MKRRILWLVPLAVLVSVPASAAPTAANASAGQSLFDDGLRLKKAGQIPEALDKFQRSEELSPSVGALVQIGDCYEKLDKPASAWGAYTEAKNLATRLSDPRLAEVAKRADALAPKLAHLTLAVPKIEGLSVTRSGTKIDPATYDTDVPIDHGRYTIEATAPNHKPWTGHLDVAPGASAKLTIPELEPVAVSELLPPPKPREPAASSSQRTVGIALEIGGGAILATGLVFGALTMGAWSSAEKNCPDGRCQTSAKQSDAQPDADRASTFAVISTIGVIAGAAALAGGIVLHLTAPKNVAISPAIGQGLYGLSFTLIR
jgi:hypothetical protein